MELTQISQIVQELQRIPNRKGNRKRVLYNDPDYDKLEEAKTNAGLEISGQYVRKANLVVSHHKTLNRFFIFTDADTNYDRSLRRMRRKVRYNFYEGIFKPTLFITFTLDPEHFEANERKVNVSAHIRKVFNNFNMAQGYSPSRAWRLEVGTKNTKRPHVHILINLRNPQKDFDALLKYWEWGKVTDAEVLNPQDYNKVFNYITKYMAKDSKNGEKSPDPTLYGKQRFGTSRDLINPPKSLYKPAKNIQWKSCNMIIDKNLDNIKSELDTQVKLYKPTDNQVLAWLESTFQHNYYMYERYWFTSHEKHMEYLKYKMMKRKYQVQFGYKRKYRPIRWDYSKKKWEVLAEKVEEVQYGHTIMYNEVV